MTQEQMDPTLLQELYDFTVQRCKARGMNVADGLNHLLQVAACTAIESSKPNISHEELRTLIIAMFEDCYDQALAKMWTK